MTNTTASDEEPGPHSFTLTQIKWISFLPIGPAVLSICGSVLILSFIRRRHNLDQKQMDPYERILSAMSLLDILTTIVQVLSPFLTDADEWYPTSFGNQNTCRAIGALLQLGLSNMLYYGMLSYYFLLTIRFQVTQRTFGTTIEPWMHVFCLGWGIITAIVGGWIDWYDELEFFPGCWTDNYPKGCLDECKSPMIAWITSGSVTFAVIISLIVNYLVITCYIRRRYRGGSQQWGLPLRRRQQQQQRRVSSGSISGTLHGEESQNKRIRLASTQASYSQTSCNDWMEVISLLYRMQIVGSLAFNSRCLVVRSAIPSI